MSISSGTDASGLPQQLELLLREAKELRDAQARAARVRLGILAAFVVAVAAIAWIALDRVREFGSEANLQKLAQAGTQRLEKDRDYYAQQLEGMSSRLSPVVSKAIVEQAKRDLPSFASAVEKERGPLLENLQNEFSTRLRQRFAKLRPEMDRTLIDTFPQVKDGKIHTAMITNIDRAMDAMVRKYYVADFRREVQTLYDTWDTFPAAPAPGKAEATTEDQFLGALLDLLTYKLTHHGDMSPP